jgi:hypothetical protein
MPKIALADSLHDWDSLIGTASGPAEEAPDIQDLLEKLQIEMNRVRELDHRRQRLRAEAQEATRQLKASREKSKELARRIRGHLSGMYGPTNPELVRFGMKPRPRARGDALPQIVPPNPRKRKPPRK